MKKIVVSCLGIVLLATLVYADEGALSQYQKTIQLDPNDAEAYYNMGVVYYNEKKHNQSKAQYQKAIEIYPEFSEAYYGLGTVYYVEGKYEEVRSCQNTTYTPASQLMMKTGRYYLLNHNSMN